MVGLKLEMGPDPSILLTRSKSEVDLPLTRPEEIVFDSREKNMKNLTFLGKIFQTQTIVG